MLRYGQLVRLTQDHTLEFSGHFKNVVKPWITHYDWDSYKKTYLTSWGKTQYKDYYKIIIPTGAIALLNFAYIGKDLTIYSLLLPHPDTGSFVCKGNGLKLKDPTFTEEVSKEAQDLHQGAQVMYLMHKTKETNNLKAIEKIAKALDNLSEGNIQV